jgi:hypothetical protein
MILVSLAVEKLHLPLFQLGFLEFVIGAVGVGELRPGDHILQFTAVQGLALARLGKLEVDDDMRFIIY